MLFLWEELVITGHAAGYGDHCLFPLLHTPFFFSFEIGFTLYSRLVLNL